MCGFDRLFPWIPGTESSRLPRMWLRGAASSFAQMRCRCQAWAETVMCGTWGQGVSCSRKCIHCDVLESCSLLTHLFAATDEILMVEGMVRFATARCGYLPVLSTVASMVPAVSAKRTMSTDNACARIVNPRSDPGAMYLPLPAGDVKRYWDIGKPLRCIAIMLIASAARFAVKKRFVKWKRS